MAINVAKNPNQENTKRLKDQIKKRMIEMEKKREAKEFQNYVQELKKDKTMTNEKFNEKMQEFRQKVLKKRREFQYKMG